MGKQEESEWDVGAGVACRISSFYRDAVRSDLVHRGADRVKPFCCVFIQKVDRL